ncbi:formyl transferase [Hyaloraphidium curvatum]|nr:formyl transferase [Hyaloraphidium curvatum]
MKLWRRATRIARAPSHVPARRCIARRGIATGTGPRSAPLNILFFGTDTFSVASLKALFAARTPLNGETKPLVGDLEIVVPHGAASSKAPTYIFASRMGLKAHEAPPKTLKGWQPPSVRTRHSPFDLAVVVSFGYFLPASLLRSFPLGGLNVHPSLLPKYRGSAPIQHAILNGDAETGVSIIELHHQRFDAGRIFSQIRCPILVGTSYSQLHDSLAEKGGELLVATLRDLDRYEASAETQDESQVSRAPKITRDMAHIRWAEMSAEDIYRRHQAFGLQEPLHTTFKGASVQLKGFVAPGTVMDGAQPPPDTSVPPGTIFFAKPLNALWVKCREGWIPCTVFHVQFKREQSATDFKNGYRIASMLDRFV